MINFLRKLSTFGFGKNAVGHWIWQRITAFLMILLFGWTIFSFRNLFYNFEENFYLWIKNRLNLFLFITLIIIVMHHSLLGIINICEDYITSKKIKRYSMNILKLVTLILISLSIFSLLSITNLISL